MRTAEIDMADSVHPADIDSFIDNAVWAIRSTYHTVLKASPGAAIFGRDMLFDIPFVAADWHKIGDYRQHQTDRSNKRENSKRVDYDYKVGDKVLIRKDGILRKAEQDAGVSEDRLVYHHPISQPFTTSDGSKIQVRLRHVLREDPTISYVEYLTNLKR